MVSISIWPVIISAIVAFAAGALWYSPILFGKEWAALTNMSQKDMAEARDRGVWKFYVVQFILALVMFIVMAFTVSAAGVFSASDGAFVGFLAWLGFMVPLYASGLMWKREPFRLVLIDSIYYLVVLAAGGAIIGAWVA